MYVVASFTLNKNVERVLAELEQSGIQSKHILALPLDREDYENEYDSYKKTLFEVTPIAGTILMIFGTVYGFVLEWGPIIWGLIGFFTGTGLGVLFDLYRARRKKSRRESKGVTEVFILIYCQQDQVAKIKDILRKWLALGISTFGHEMEHFPA